MNVKNVGTAGLVALLVGGMSVVPASAQNLGDLFGGGHKGSRQTDKNNMRNIGIGAGAAAAYELLHGKGTNALILGAGAAYAGKKYEDSRKAQNRENTRYGYRIYRYKDGVRIGYDEFNHSGKRIDSYNRNYDHSLRHYTSNYHRAS